MKFIICSILVFNTCFCHAGNGSLGARSQGMGGFSQTLKDVWSVGNNVSALAFLNSISIGAYLENRFLIKENSFRAFAINLPVSNGSIGLVASQYGYRLFNDNKIGLSYSKLLGKNISMGIQMNYLHTSIAEDYGTKNNISGSLGIMAKITDELYFGSSIINPTKAKLSEYQDERYPTLIKMGFSYLFSEKVLLGTEINKNMWGSTELMFGIEYQPVKLLYLRFGTSTNPIASHFGFGLDFNSFQVDFASSFHSVLGFSPYVSLIFHPLAQKNEE